MNTLVTPSPTDADFGQLGPILTRLADARTALGDTLYAALGDDMDLYKDAAAFKKKAAHPKKYFQFCVMMQGMLGPRGAGDVLMQAPSASPGGVYGRLLAEAAGAHEQAANHCHAAREAQDRAAQAYDELAAWFDGQGLCGDEFRTKAAKDRWEAGHLAAWASQLRPPVTTGLAGGDA